MARIDDIERRLQNWARWKDGGGAVGGYAGVDLEAGDTSTLYREARIPTVACEAEETDRAVMTLESVLRRTVEEVYLAPTSYAKKAEALHCGVAAVHARIERAHRHLQQWFDDLQRARQAERERVERMQRRGFYTI